MKWLVKVLSIAMLGLSLPAFAGGVPATLYKNPSCTCCENYARYLKGYGFDVKVVATHDLVEMHKQNGVPDKLASCHITKINPYIFEGHIPVESVKRVLKERPFIKGLSVPGMPAGSPGMTGNRKEPLDVYVISIGDAASNATSSKVYATH